MSPAAKTIATPKQKLPPVVLALEELDLTSCNFTTECFVASPPAEGTTQTTNQSYTFFFVSNRPPPPGGFNLNNLENAEPETNPLTGVSLSICVILLIHFITRCRKPYLP